MRFLQSGKNTGRVIIDYSSAVEPLEYRPCQHLHGYMFTKYASFVISGGLGGLGALNNRSHMLPRVHRLPAHSSRISGAHFSTRRRLIYLAHTDPSFVASKNLTKNTVLFKFQYDY